MHDLLLRLGDLTLDEIAARSRIDASRARSTQLVRDAPRDRGPHRRGEPRSSPVEDAARYRDALGVPLPPGLPESLLEPAAERGAAISRGATRARTGRSPRVEFAARYGARPRDGGSAAAASSPRRAGCSRASSGPAARAASGATRTCCSRSAGDRSRSCASEVEPVEPPVLGRLLTSWQGVVRQRAGLDALLDAIENLQGAPLPPRSSRREILAARVERYNPADLDALTAAGEVVWAASSRSASATAESRST